PRAGLPARPAPSGRGRPTTARDPPPRPPARGLGRGRRPGFPPTRPRFPSRTGTPWSRWSPHPPPQGPFRRGLVPAATSTLPLGTGGGPLPACRRIRPVPGQPRVLAEPVPDRVPVGGQLLHLGNAVHDVLQPAQAVGGEVFKFHLL